MEHDINNILKKIKIPEPDQTARNNAVKAALDEFNQHNISIKEKKIKGIEEQARQTGILNIFYTVFGGRVMKKRFVIASGVTAFLAIVGYSLFYYFTSIKYTPESIIVAQNDLLNLGVDSESEFRGYDDLIVDGKRERLLALQEPNRKIVHLEKDRVVSEIPVRQNQKELKSNDVIPGASDVENISAPKPTGMKLKRESAIKGLQSKSLEDRDGVFAKPSKSKKASKIMDRLEVSKLSKQDFIVGSAPISVDIKTNVEYQDVGRDKFDKIVSNPVKQVSVNPVSTFSVDVDTASYSFVRRELNNGRLPQKDAVRIEEMINYFKYDYSVPSDRSEPFQPNITIYPSPWNKDRKLLQIGIKCYDIIPEDKLMSNLVFLIDVSGSMNSKDKLPLLKNSIRMLVNNLNDDDSVAIVVYAGSAGTVLETTKVKDKGKIFAALDQLQAGGSTAGGEGIEKAYALAEANYNKEAVNRIILATDGDFNVGIRNPEELKSFVERKRETGIFLSILGFGQGNYNDALMQKLAQNGNGNAAYIDNLNEARKVLVEEASSTLFPVAKDVKLQIEFNPNRIAEYRLIGYESRGLKREDFNNDKIDAGDIGSGHSVTAIYEVTSADSKNKQVDDFRYTENKPEDIAKSDFGQEYGFLKIRYKLPEAKQSKLITTPITTANEYNNFNEAPADSRFAASVAAFGQLLRGGSYTGALKYDDLLQMAMSAMGNDQFGYRHEFLNLVRLAISIK